MMLVLSSVDNWESLALRTWISSITQLQGLDQSFDVSQFAMTLALLIVYRVYLSFDMLSTCNVLVQLSQ